MRRMQRGLSGRALSALLVLVIAAMFPIVPAAAGTTRTDVPQDEKAVRPLSWSAANVRIAGTDRLHTAVTVSQQGWDSSEYVVIATARNFPDALVGGPLAYAYDAPILLAESDGLSDEVSAEIERLGATKAVVLGGFNAVSLEVEFDLLDAGIAQVERIAGIDRYDTARKVAERCAQLAGDSDGVILSTGLNYPDALAVSGFAGWFGTPILLTRPDSLPAATLEAFGTLEPNSVLIIGGPAAVSQRVEDSLPSPVRIGGANRYDTARLIAEFAFANGFTYQTVFTATGLDFPDALAAAPLTAKLKAPMVLTEPNVLSSATSDFFNSHCSSIQTVFILGGLSAVSEGVADAITAATETQLSEQVEVVSEALNSGITTVSPEGTMVFDASTPGLESIQTSDILVAAPSASAPYGYLRRVTAVNIAPTAGETVSIETTMASLDEVILKGSLDVTGSADPNFGSGDTPTFGVSSAEAVDGEHVDVQFAPTESLAPAGVDPAFELGGSAEFPFEIGISTNGADAFKKDSLEFLTAGAKVSGSVFVQGSFVMNIAFGTVGYHWEQEWYWDWGLKSRWVQKPTWGIQNFETKVYLAERFELGLDLEVGVEFTADIIKILREKLRQRTEVTLANTVVWVGWVPVYLGTSAEPVFELSASIGGRLHIGFEQGSSVTVGKRYDYRYGWSNIGAHTQNFTFTPELAGTAGLSASVGVKIKVKFYGLIGPYFGGQATVGVEADTAEDPWWEAGLALDGIFGGEFEVFSRKWEIGGSVTFLDWTIAEAPGPFFTPGIVWFPSGASSSSALPAGVTPVFWDTGGVRPAGSVTPAPAPALALDPTSVQPGDFVVPGLTVLGAVLQPDRQTVRLTTTPHAPRSAYAVSCAARGVFDAQNLPNGLSFAKFIGHYSPGIIGVRSIDANTIEVGFQTYGGSLDASSVASSDFTVPGLTVADAVLQPDGMTVLLTTSAQSSGVAYNIGVASGAILSTEGFLSANSSASLVGFYRPMVVAAVPLDATTLQLTFDTFGGELDALTVEPSDFTIPGLAVTGATLLPDGATVVLSTDPQGLSVGYTVSVADGAIATPEGYPGVASGAGFTGYYRPAIVSATVLDAVTVELAFDASDGAIDPASVAPADFTIPGLAVTGATLLPDGATVVLTTDPQAPAAAYAVSVADGAIATPEGYPGVASGAGFTGYYRPTLTSATVIDAVTVELSFDTLGGAIDPASVAPSDFTIPGLAVTGATLLPDGATVVLSTDSQVPTAPYAVSVADGALATPEGYPCSASGAGFVGFEPAVTGAWSAVTNPNPTLWWSTAANTSGRIWIVGGAASTSSPSNPGKMISSVDGGATFATVASPAGTHHIAGIDFIDDTTGWVAGYAGYIAMTTDAGATWTTQRAQNAVPFSHIRDIAFVSATTGFAPGGGGLLWTTDGGTTWNLHADATGGLNRVQFADSANGWIVGEVGAIYNTRDGGTTWTSQVSGTTRTLSDIEAIGPSEAWAGGAAGTLLHTTDGGATWDPVSTGIAADIGQLAFHEGLGFLTTSDKKLFSTRDGGVTWVEIPTGWPTSMGLNGVLLDDDASNIVLFGQNGTLRMAPLTDNRPRVVSADAPTLTTVEVTFAGAEPLNPATVDAGDFVIPGLGVTGATLLPDGFTVALTTDPQMQRAPYQVSVKPGSLSDAGAWVCASSSAQFLGDWDVVMLDAGGNHYLAVDSDGMLWAWGANTTGQLGTGDTSAASTPTPIAFGPWKDIEAAAGYSFGVKADGTLWAWGSNASGQLGLGSTGGNVLVPTPVGAGTDWVDIDAWTIHTLGVRESAPGTGVGTLWSWGADTGEVLGNGAGGAVNVPTQVGAATDWTHVAAGKEHSIAIKSNGDLWGWGLNGFGQIGNGSAGTQTAPVLCNSARNWVSISAGNWHSVGLDDTGAMYVWGHNGFGQIGDGSTTHRYSPTLVSSVQPWTHITAGHSITAGRKADGTVWIWGNTQNPAGGNALDPIQRSADTDWTFLTSGQSTVLAMKADLSPWVFDYAAPADPPYEVWP